MSSYVETQNPKYNPVRYNLLLHSLSLLHSPLFIRLISFTLLIVEIKTILVRFNLLSLSLSLSQTPLSQHWNNFQNYFIWSWRWRGRGRGFEKVHDCSVTQI